MSGDISIGTRRETGAQVIAPPPLIYLAGLGLGLAVEAAIPGGEVAAAIAIPLGGALIVVGAVLLRGFVGALHRVQTSVRPGLPATALVTSGLYRFSRNPGYLGMAAVFAGVALLAQAPLALTALPVTLLVIDRGVIAREERYLAARFGDSYAAYISRVRRWL